MSHYLITGGAGFIGSHLAEHLAAQSHNVTVIDDLSSGSLQNLAPLRGNPRFRFVESAVQDEAVLDRAVSECDAIYHLAARVGVQRVVNDPAGSMSSNLLATELVCRAAIRHRRPLLLTSSSEVYGRSRDLPFREDGPLCLGAPSVARWSYACAKAIDEFRLLAAFRSDKLRTVVVRLFNTVGPRQSSLGGMVLPRFINQALSGQPLTIYGDGTQTRCFAYVTDVVTAFARLFPMDAATGRIFNIGSDREVTIIELARAVLRHSKLDTGVRFLPFERAFGENFEDIPRRVPDLSRARRLLGEVCPTSLDEIVRRTLASVGRAAAELEAARAPLRPARRSASEGSEVS